jgi:hypothetical protein
MGGVMLALYLVSAVLSVSPQLHQLLHSGSDQPGHECLLTSLSKGQLLPAAAGESRPACPEPTFQLPRFAPSVVLPAPVHPLSASRAPPVSRFHSLLAVSVH